MSVILYGLSLKENIHLISNQVFYYTKAKDNVFEEERRNSIRLAVELFAEGELGVSANTGC